MVENLDAASMQRFGESILQIISNIVETSMDEEEEEEDDDETLALVIDSILNKVGKAFWGSTVRQSFNRSINQSIN